MSNTAKNFDTLVTNLSLHNYFDISTKLFSNLAKFVNTLAKVILFVHIIITFRTFIIIVLHILYMHNSFVIY